MLKKQTDINTSEVKKNASEVEQQKDAKIIGVDAGCLGVSDERLKVGVYQVAFNLLKELGRIDKKNFYKLYSFYPIEKGVLAQFGKRMKNIVLRPSLGWFKIRLPLELKLHPVDVFLGLSQALPHSTSHNILLVYDLAFEFYPEFYPDSYKKLSKNTRSSLKLAHKVIAISKSTKKDLVRLYNVQEDKIKVCYPGVDKNFKPRGEKFKLNTPYFLFVGSLKKKKNIPKILTGFSYFLKKTGFDYRLVIIGGDFWLDPEIKKTVRELTLGKKVKIPGFVKKEELPKYYRGATAFVSPSLYEGGGLTLIEAMACGCPVITANISAMPEVVEDAGILVNPKDEKQIGEAMIKIVSGRNLRNDLIKKGLSQAKKFSWEKFAKGVWGELE